MPPHWLHAGPRSRATIRAGRTGGVSVSAAVGGFEPPLPPATGPPLPPPLDRVAGGPAVSEDIEVMASSAAFLARTSAVRIPSSSWIWASRKRDASQRMI